VTVWYVGLGLHTRRSPTCNDIYKVSYW